MARYTTHAAPYHPEKLSSKYTSYLLSVLKQKANRHRSGGLLLLVAACTLLCLGRWIMG